MRTIAIGDIHGCRASLEALAEFAGFTESDTIVTLGDYVDRGPDSKGVIDFLLALRERVTLVTLMGNHELMMLDARDSPPSMRGWASEGVGGAATLASYGARTMEEIPAEHWAFIEGCREGFEIDTHFFVHANVVPDCPLNEQPSWILYWERFDDPKPHVSGKVMVCGHTAQASGKPVNLGHAICIDTKAHGGGWLTALEVGSGNYWQTNERGERRSGDIAEFQRT